MKSNLDLLGHVGDRWQSSQLQWFEFTVLADGFAKSFRLDVVDFLQFEKLVMAADTVKTCCLQRMDYVGKEALPMSK